MRMQTRSRDISRLLLLSVAAAALALFAFSGNLAHAATITVTTTTDELNSDGDCSLREAVQAANTDAAVDACAAGNGVDIIALSANTYTLSIPGAGEDANATGDLDITSAVGIVGVGSASTTIDGGGIDRVLHVLSGTLAATDLTIQHGRAGSGAGILNDATVILIDSSVTENTSYDADSPAGGILNNGFLALTDSTLTGNSSAGSGGGIGNYGTLSVTNSTLAGNSAAALGGGIDNRGTLTVLNSTFSENSALSGGAIGNLGMTTITNSTFAANSADEGGGINNKSEGTLTVTNSTLSGNSAATFGGAIINGGTVTFRNTILADSPSGGNCASHAPITDGGGNLQHPGTTCGGTITSADPLLDPAGPQANGAPTRTIALQPGSPAIDAALAIDCPVADQRWVSRSQGTGCDIGAFEREMPAAAVPDADNDGFDDAVEISVGTDSRRACGADAWPADTNNDTYSDMWDLVAFSGAFGQSGSARYDVSPAGAPDGFVDSFDLVRVAGLFGQSCQ